MPNYMGFEYESNGFEITITGYKGSSDSLNIPSRIEGLPVTSIGWSAFFKCRSLTSITIPNSVTSIGKQAFSDCSSLMSIKIPDSVTFISNGAFSDCDSLKTIRFPNSLRNVKGDNNTLERFRNEYSDKIRYYKAETQIKETIEMPDFWRSDSAKNQTETEKNFKYSRTYSGIHIDKYVGRNAFVAIPENIENLPVESIGYRAFENDNLYKVVIPASIKNIVYCAFVSQQPMHVFFKGDSIKMIAQSFLAPKVTFYFINANIYDDIYQITKNNPKYHISYNAADFDEV